MRGRNDRDAVPSVRRSIQRMGMVILKRMCVSDFSQLLLSSLHWLLLKGKRPAAAGRTHILSTHPQSNESICAKRTADDTVIEVMINGT